jgi:alpha-L-rhamnosidase
MNSFNHHAYGAIGDWMYRVMAGIEIDPAAPGFRHVLIQPEPGGGFTRVGAAHDSMYGRVSSSWSIEQGTFVLEVEVPANAGRMREGGGDDGGNDEWRRASPAGRGCTGGRRGKILRPLRLGEDPSCPSFGWPARRTSPSCSSA